MWGKLNNRDILYIIKIIINITLLINQQCKLWIGYSIQRKFATLCKGTDTKAFTGPIGILSKN